VQDASEDGSDSGRNVQHEVWTALKARKESLEAQLRRKLDKLKDLCVKEAVSGAVWPYVGSRLVARVSCVILVKVKVNFRIAYCYETIIFQYAIVTDRAGVQPIGCRLGSRPRAQACS